MDWVELTTLDGDVHLIRVEDIRSVRKAPGGAMVMIQGYRGPKMSPELTVTAPTYEDLRALLQKPILFCGAGGEGLASPPGTIVALDK